MTTALIVVDVQKFFVKKGASSLPLRIKSHLANHRYDVIIFTTFVNRGRSPVAAKLRWHHCKGPPETDIADELASVAHRHRVFEKSTYSAFKSRPFTDFLKRRRVSKLFFCGVDLDACVLASAFDAFDLGFDYEILTELTAGSDKNAVEAAKLIIRRNL